MNYELTSKLEQLLKRMTNEGHNEQEIQQAFNDAMITIKHEEKVRNSKEWKEK